MYQFFDLTALFLPKGSKNQFFHGITVFIKPKTTCLIHRSIPAVMGSTNLISESLLILELRDHGMRDKEIIRSLFCPIVANDVGSNLIMKYVGVLIRHKVMLRFELLGQELQRKWKRSYSYSTRNRGHV